MSFRKQSEVMNLQPLEMQLHHDDISDTNLTAGKVTPECEIRSGEVRSLLHTNYRDQAALRNGNRLYDHNDQWTKGSLGMISGSMARFTSEGKNLTEGLNYSSSALDAASHANI